MNFQERLAEKVEQMKAMTRRNNMRNRPMRVHITRQTIVPLKQQMQQLQAQQDNQVIRQGRIRGLRPAMIDLFSVRKVSVSMNELGEGNITTVHVLPKDVRMDGKGNLHLYFLRKCLLTVGKGAWPLKRLDASAGPR